MRYNLKLPQPLRVGVIHYNSHAIFDRLEFFTPGCQLCELLIRHTSVRSMLQQKFEISVNIQVVCLCHLNYCIDNCTGVCSIYRTAKQPVPPAYCEWPDCILAELCECSHNSAYPTELLMRIFIRKPL